MDPPAEPLPGETAPPATEQTAFLPVIDNPFMDGDLEYAISLSIYNGPEDIYKRKPRPMTT